MHPEDQTPPVAATQDTPPPETDEAPLQHAVQEAVTAIADVAMAPVEEVLGHALWLRWALLCHLAATLAATLIAFFAPFADWQVYGVAGLLTGVLIANFMRWGPTTGWFHRAWTTLAALVVDLVWMLLLFDRARAGRLHASSRPGLALAADASLWFWLPVLLLLACGALLVAHGILAPRHRLRHIHHAGPKGG